MKAGFRRTSLVLAVAILVAAGFLANGLVVAQLPDPIGGVSRAADEAGNGAESLQPPARGDVFEGPPAGIGGDFGFGDALASQEVTISAAFTDGRGGQPARLFVTAELIPEWHIYSLTQSREAGIPTKITLEPSGSFQLTGPFQPDRAPKIHETALFPVPLEEYYESVTFSASIRFAAGVDPATVRITGELDGMVCRSDEACIPLAGMDTKFEARLASASDAQALLQLAPGQAGAATAGAAAEGYRAPDTHGVILGHIEPETVMPGGRAMLVITATLDPDWHIYAFTEKSVPDDISNPTRVVLKEPPGWELSPLVTESQPVKEQFGEFPPTFYHEGTVTWTGSISVPADAEYGQYAVSGLLGYQTCSSTCDRPVAAEFSALVRVGPQMVPGRTPLGIQSAAEKYKEVVEQADTLAGPLAGTGAADPGSVGSDPTAAAETGAAAPKFDAAQVRPDEVVEATSLWGALAFAFLGGLILNVMPCVLPVIGLKVLSFFDQAGQSRSRAFWLNVWYALGLLSVFLVLAALGVGLSSMFTARLFGVIMSVVVFAMALSLMGLWELRTPGFLGRGKAQELTEKEGVVGAFFKGIITTLLAIPCGAPLLSPALKWAQLQVTAGAPQNVYLVFGVIGLGMASPYLIIGANPELLRFLPKPGAWMETFKKAMGYCLLPAVVWILYFLPLEDVVATVALLFAIWAACWLVGRLPITEPTATKAWSWVVALLLVAGTYYVSFHLILRPAAEKQVAKAAAAQIADGQQDEGVFQRFVKLQGDGGAIQLPTGSDTAVVVDPSGGTGIAQAGESSEKAELPWEPFDRERFEQLVAANKTILIDFTADWCLTCKTLEALVLNTRRTRSAVDRNGVITMVADWTRGDPEVTEMLEILGSRQVPVVAIFPAGNPNEPIVLRGGYKQSTLLEAIKKAGPSAGVSPNGRTAMRAE